jgi:hypothetical protein
MPIKPQIKLLLAGYPSGLEDKVNEFIKNQLEIKEIKFMCKSVVGTDTYYAFIVYYPNLQNSPILKNEKEKIKNKAAANKNARHGVFKIHKK